MPGVSVCIPTFNRAAFLSVAVESVLAQSHRDLEVIISDNGSTDGTPGVAAAFGDRRLRYVRHPRPIGMAENWACVVEMATGAYCAVLADDDRWDKAFLERLLGPLERDARVDVAFCDHFIMDAEGQVRADESEACTRRFRAHVSPGLHQPFAELALRVEALLPTAALFRRRRLVETGALSAQTGVHSAYSMFGALALAGGGAYYVSERLAYYRVHGQSASATVSAEAWRAHQAACAWLIRQAAEPQARAWIRANWFQAMVHEGVALLRRGDRPGAIRAFWRAVVRAPWRATPWIGLALSLLGLYGRYRALRAHLGPLQRRTSTP